ncbi:MAG: lysophospholipid acyltransferase family protein [Armatimonadota bacterium]|nr:lysophospholipid acyltransferase family protein [Armatimonadota bacterium]
MTKPEKSPFLHSRFMAYNRWYLSRSFHRIHLLENSPSLVSDGQTPILVYMSHSSWWDMLVALFINEEFFGWDSYGVMDKRQLERYRFFSKLGMMGVDRTTLRGAKEFITNASGFLRGQPRALWIAPQGEMVSNAMRPLRFQPGLAHLVEAVGDCYCTPVVLDYEFWADKLPEAFVAYGTPERVTVESSFDRHAFLKSCEEKLAAEMDCLTELRLQRDPILFRTLLQGQGGISPLYDVMRGAWAHLRGEEFSAAHGDVKTGKYGEKS